ncbi:MAG: hypothetical protein VYE08_03685, partial [Candidatus Thermoplasmatota archaeon]|nr:hypothetical protein [Candidatus Thermoplasmatota archaeon]
RSKAETEEQPADLRMNQADEASLWDEEVAQTPAELKRPGGWTAEQYATWLSGPRPEGWSDEAWTAFVQEQQLLNV